MELPGKPDTPGFLIEGEFYPFPAQFGMLAPILVERSFEIIEQVHGKIPAGPIMPGKMPKNLKPPAGWTYVRTENSLGETGYYLVSRGGTEPWRFKMRTPSFHNVSMIPELLRGVLLPDLISVLGSVFFVVGDVDR